MSFNQIEINFYQKATTAIQRSSQGVACLVLQDEAGLKKHEFLSTLSITGLNTKNTELVKQCFLGKPKKIIVVAVAETTGTFADAIPLLEESKFNWFACNIAGEQEDVSTYFKTQKNIKAIVNNVVADHKQIVNFPYTSLKLADDTDISGLDYLCRLVGLFAGLPMTRSATNIILPDLKNYTNISIQAGQLGLRMKNGVVKLGSAVNSLTTLQPPLLTKDMQKIAIVEAMNLIDEDIDEEFENNYLGKYKNSYDNQLLFISAVNTYFSQLGKEDILDKNYKNICSVDIARQRQLWIDSGKSEALDWTETQIKNNTFSSYLNALNDIKVLDAIENLVFNVEMF